MIDLAPKPPLRTEREVRDKLVYWREVFLEARAGVGQVTVDEARRELDRWLDELEAFLIARAA